MRALVWGRPRFCFVLKGFGQLKALPYFNSIAAIMAQLRSFKAASLPEWEFCPEHERKELSGAAEPLMTGQTFPRTFSNQMLIFVQIWNIFVWIAKCICPNERKWHGTDDDSNISKDFSQKSLLLIYCAQLNVSLFEKSGTLLFFSSSFCSMELTLGTSGVAILPM